MRAIGKSWTAIGTVGTDSGLRGSAVGKEVAAVAKEFVDKLYEMARKWREESPSTSMKRWVEEVEHKVGEVTGLLKKHAELKDGEAGNNKPHKGDEKK
ncbi:hypothetical protein Tco_0837980 [Tanacetum coccineum]